MARKIKLTRPELKRQRDMLARFERYLPMLKLKQQQLQMRIRQTAEELSGARDHLRQATETFTPYENVLSDIAGVDVRGLSKPAKVRTISANVAGIGVPVFEGTDFPQASYSLFGSPTWVDRALADLREISTRQAKLDVLSEQHRILQRELTKITQRVNLFEKVKIPESREAIRVIRIRLGDEMTAGVARAKMAKSKIEQSEEDVYEAVGPGTSAKGPTK